MGAVGCGVATAFCYWFMALAMLYYLRRDPQYRDLRPLFASLFFRRGLSDQRAQEPRFDGALVLRVLRIACPARWRCFSRFRFLP